MNRTNCVMIYLSTTHGCMNKHGIFIIDQEAWRYESIQTWGLILRQVRISQPCLSTKKCAWTVTKQVAFFEFFGCPTNRTMVAFIGDRLSSWLIICKLPYHHCWLVSTCILHRGLVTNYKSKCNNYFWLLQLWGEHTRRYPNARRLAHVYCNKNVSAAAG